jgi:hypothetical protein
MVLFLPEVVVRLVMETFIGLLTLDVTWTQIEMGAGLESFIH